MKDNKGKPTISTDDSAVYWGWWVVFGSFLILAVNYGTRYCFGVFLKPMTEDYGWSRSVIALGASVNMFVYSAGAIFMGRLIDRMAPRWIITTGATVAAASFILTAFVTTPLAFYGVYGLLCGLGSAGMGVVVVNSSVGKWFIRRRGTAIGVTTMGISLGTVLLTPAAGYIVNYHGWRAGFIFMGIVTFFIGVTLSQVFLRRGCPEECGLLPDGEKNPEFVVPASKPDVETPTFGSLLSDRRFLVIAVTFGTAIMSLMAVFVHQPAFAVDRGIDRLAAASSLGATAMAGFVGQFFFGWISDRTRDPKYAAAGGLVIMAVGMVFLMGVKTAGDLYRYALVFGFGYGSLAPLMPILLADRFGRHILGTVYGYVTLFIGGGGAVGPVLAGMIYDQLGSYWFVWILNLVLLIAAATVILTLRGGASDRLGAPRNVPPAS